MPYIPLCIFYQNFYFRMTIRNCVLTTIQKTNKDTITSLNLDKDFM